jgi:hypothetical protein
MLSPQTVLRHSNAAVWIKLSTTLLGRKNPRADGHSHHLAEFFQDRKPDHLQQPNLSNRITQIDYTTPPTEIAVDWKTLLRL